MLTAHAVAFGGRYVAREGLPVNRFTPSGFEVRVPLAKTWKDDAGDLWVEGVASSTEVDRQSERMSLRAIELMSQAQAVPLLPGHQSGRLRELGAIEECWVDNDEFRVRGRLDRTNPDARRLYERLARGRRCGLSVGGRVRDAHWEADEATGRSVRVIDEVELDHIALCRLGDAANPSAYLSVMGAAAGLAAEDEPVSEEEANTAEEACPVSGGTVDRLSRARGIDVVTSIGRFLAGLAAALRPPGQAEGGDAAEREARASEELSLRLDAVCRDVAQLVQEVEGLGSAVGKASRPLPVEPAEARNAGVSRGLTGQERAMARESHIWKGVL